MREHVDSPDCWCDPGLEAVPDPRTGELHELWVHWATPPTDSSALTQGTDGDQP